MSPNAIDLIVYIRKSDKILKNWGNNELFQKISDAVTDRTIACTVDKDGQITGFALGVKELNKNVLHIIAVQANTRKDLSNLIKKFYRDYPEWQLSSLRKGKYILYNTPKLCRRLSIT